VVCVVVMGTTLHIGLMVGSNAKHEVWPELADWLREGTGH
jgi:hypothetical protein